MAFTVHGTAYYIVYTIECIAYNVHCIPYGAYTTFGKYCHRGLLNACGTLVKRSVIGLARGKR